jgi:DNA-binding SARP family transcriptional activator/tetratricopeptide (TPR) repeat protein
LASNVVLTLLGPVDANVDGRSADLGYPRQRCAFAALLIDANRVVAVDTLASRVWGDNAPRSARNVLSGYVSRLRSAFAGVVGLQFVRRSGGYATLIDPELVDLYRFRRLVAAADAIDDDMERVAVIESALGLWQGDALDGLPGAWSAATRQALAHERLAAQLAHNDVLLRLGRHAQSLPRLHALAVEHPLDERLASQLILAAYRSGDQAAAIESYHHIRTRLVEELGVDPAPQLRQLYQQVLSNDPALAPPQTHAAAADGIARADAAIRMSSTNRAPAPVVPGQLPLDVAGFTGRTAELAQLDELLDSVGRHPTAVLVTAVSGTAGIGKTALAVHWAHRVAEQFPDGQLYINLRGFDPGGSVIPPGEALRRFIEALGVAPERVPAVLESRVDLYRSLLVGKRILVVLDNAATVEAVRLLLPGAPRCLVVVTSRNTFTGLIAVEGARPIVLDLLTDDEAHALLRERLGAQRVAAEPKATAEIVDCCARLPLALVVAAARAATQPRLPLGTLAKHLRDARARLNTLAGDEPQTDMRAVFSWSYQALTPAAAALFRLLGLHPGPDISAPAAASLTAYSLPETRSLLIELARANLLTEHASGRYACHDLLHEYAAELAQRDEDDVTRRHAVGRMLDHYLYAAQDADNALTQPEVQSVAVAQRPAIISEQFADHHEAGAWFAAECAVLLRLVDRSNESGNHAHTWRLVSALSWYLNRRARWSDTAEIAQTGLAAAVRLDDPNGRIRMHRAIATADLHLGRFDEAHYHLRHALELCRQHEDREGEAAVHIWLADAYVRQDRHREALHHDQLGLDLYRSTGDQAGQAVALNGIGWCHSQLGQHDEAINVCEQALAVFQSLGDRFGEGCAWDSLGDAYHHLGKHTRAIDYYRCALDQFREIGDSFHQAIILEHIGDAHRSAGDRGAAKQAWREALTALVGIDDPAFQRIRTKMGPDEET